MQRYIRTENLVTNHTAMLEMRIVKTQGDGTTIPIHSQSRLGCHEIQQWRAKMVQIFRHNLAVNPLPAGGCLTPSEKRLLCVTPFFAYIISHHFCIFSKKIVPRSPQVRSSDSFSQKVCDATAATGFERSKSVGHQNFLDIIRPSIATKWIFRFFWWP